jgi:polyhydroxyalkanoate synthase
MPGGLSPASALLAWQDWAVHLANSPGKQMALAQLAGTQAQALSQYMRARLQAAPDHEQVLVEPPAQDRRFVDPAWRKWPFCLWQQSFLLTEQWWDAATHGVSGVDRHHENMVSFWARQWLDMFSPGNRLATNPLALRRTVEELGANLVRGAQHLVEDLQQAVTGTGPETGFTVGRDVAVTPGQVVLRNRVMELIQYAPVTERVHAVPIVLVAPWINKFYIMDLSPRNSLVRYLIGQGFTVFVTSWKNPGPEARATTLADYLLRGVRPALEAARTICGVPQIHATGYCLGGTALALLLAWLAADPADRAANPVAHWTTFTTLVDFSDPGEIGVFLSQASFDFLRQRMAGAGYLDGAAMARAFRLLRPNNLIWHYVVQSYLFGEDLPPSDVLFWNCDTTRMPAAMHEFYLRELYLNNRLVRSGELEIGGRRLDLGAISQPLYAVGAEQDHIAPWRQTFRLCGLIGAPARYVLATSGHILGIINPPVDPPKRRYWLGDATGQGDPDAWIGGIAKVPGSWWEDWSNWLRERCGPPVPPPAMGGPDYPPLQAAPGQYVLEK